jgi:Fic family protein
MAPKYPALRQANIPFDVKLTDAFVGSLMKIAECKPFLDEVSTTPFKIQLLRQAKIRAITYSNQIEGNQLDERAVTALLGSKEKKGSNKDAKEILNYQTAHSYAEELAKDKRFPSSRDFCDLQKLVVGDLIQKNQLGRFRTVPVSIVNEATRKEIEKCPEPHQLTYLMQELWEWLKETEGMNPYARAFAFHYIAVAIHPFADGNGRTVRLFQHVLLLRGGEPIARYVPSETVVMRNRDRYYSAIRQCKTLQSLHPMVEFMAECFATAAKEVVEEARSIHDAAKKMRPEARKKKVIDFALKYSPFQMKDLVEFLPDIPRRTLERDVDELVESGHLVAEGEKKGRTYVLSRRKIR